VKYGHGKPFDGSTNAYVKLPLFVEVYRKGSIAWVVELFVRGNWIGVSDAGIDIASIG
jgi:hypothetical protein